MVKFFADSKENYSLIQVDKLEGELKKTLTQNEQERVALISDYTDQIKSLETRINKRQDDIVLMQNELKHVKVMSRG